MTSITMDYIKEHLDGVPFEVWHCDTTNSAYRRYDFNLDEKLDVEIINDHKPVATLQFIGAASERVIASNTDQLDLIIKAYREETSLDVNQGEVVDTQSYFIELITFKDGSQAIHRTNDGFSALELVGLLEHTKGEIYQQMAGAIEPTIIERNFVQQS